MWSKMRYRVPVWSICRHVRCCLQYPDAQVVAVCDVDRWRREHAKAAVETRYAEQRAAGTYRGCQACNDLRVLLAREDIDAVLIATGDRWHALATVMAAKAGKDVYCEKPISLTVREARAMVHAVRRYGRVFQGGLQQRSTAEFHKACDLVRRGAIGKIRVVYVNHPGTCGDVSLPAEPVPEGLDWDLWLGPAPWRPTTAVFIRTAGRRTSCPGTSAEISAAATSPATPYMPSTWSSGASAWTIAAPSRSLPPRPGRFPH